jgi:AcrR family transcriptional regulator
MSVPPLPSSPTPGVRPPQQARAQETFDRVLSIGAELVADKGFGGLSITEVCQRAGVSAGALYARVDSKEALELAIHDRELARMALEHTVFDPSPRWAALDSDRLILDSVFELGAHYARHAALLRAFILRSSVDETMHQRGSATTEAIARRLCALWLTRAGELPHPDPARATQTAWRLMHAGLNWRVAYGPRLSGPTDPGWTQHVEDVAAATRAYLRVPLLAEAAPPPGASPAVVTQTSSMASARARSRRRDGRSRDST